MQSDSDPRTNSEIKPPYKIFRIKKHSQKIFIQEHKVFQHILYLRPYLSSGTPDDFSIRKSTIAYGTLHSFAGNYGFLDGHVSSIHRVELDKDMFYPER
jgi:prepilin-type processing-associated H-X9-DG protein